MDGVVNSKLVLGINPTYFQLTGGLERWLYRTARKFAGINPHGTRYTLKHLHERSGSGSSYRKFKQNVKKTIEKGNIPDYHFGLYYMKGKDWLHFSKKEQAEEAIHPLDEIKDFELIAESPK